MRKLIAVPFVVLLLSVSALAESSAQPSPEQLTPEQLWSELKAGNELFVKGQVVYGSLRSARSMWATAQNPPVSILSCADSRVPAEIVFQRTVGELFVVRVAGNVEDEFGIASLEYAIKNRWTRQIVVMGHSDCGAVKASLSKPEPGKPTPSLYALILRIRQSFSSGEEDLRTRTIENVCYTAARLKRNATIGETPIKTAFYDLATGVVEEVRCPAMTGEDP